MTVTTTAATARCLVAPANELLVHALAQLPDDVTMQLTGPTTGPSLSLLARAYGVDDRLELVPEYRGAPPRTVQSLAEVVESLTTADDPPASTDRDDAVLAGHRAVVVTNLPTHYRVPLFRSVARRIRDAGGAFRVLFLSPIPSSRAWMQSGELDFDHEFVAGIDVGRDRGRRVLPRRLESRLAAFEPTLVVSGGFSPAVSGRAARFARRHGIPFGIWSGEIATRATAQSRVRTFQRRRLLRTAGFGIAYGSRSAEYLRTLAPSLPAVIARNTTIVDTRPKQSSETLELLTVSRAEPEKALDLAVEAVRSRRDLRCRLTIIGDGPELPRLRALAEGDSRIRFLGAVSSDEVLDHYAEADVFLFPSRYDVFGQVLVEAMGAGVAPVVSAAPGAVADLCVHEHNALVVREATVAAWAAALDRAAAPGVAKGLGVAAASTVARRWTIDHSADAFLAGLRLGALVEAGGRA